MKKNLIYFLVLLLFPAVLAACSEDDLSSTSVIQPPQVVQNDFDRWLDRHYLAPYNIEFQYRYTDIESSMGYYLTPADYNQSIALAKLVIALCLEPYDEVTGSRDFIRAYFPKIIFLTGSPAYKSNGSIILGTAEGGKYLLQKLRRNFSAFCNVAQGNILILRRGSQINQRPQSVAALFRKLHK